MKKPIYQGSVKNIYQLEDKLEFEFSNRYSIYDWGEMPDHIPNKGKYLTSIATFFFDYLGNAENFNNLIVPEFLDPSKLKEFMDSDILIELQKNGLKNHFLAKKSENSFYAHGVNVFRPKYINANYDYSPYRLRPEHTIIPLEVVFRMGAPIGSSLLVRDHAHFKQTHNIATEIVAGEFFDNISVEFYTKLEPTDRLLSQNEAKKISGLSDVEFSNLKDTTKILALVLFQKFESIGFELWDGKFEFAFGEMRNGKRDLILIDSIGPDELRLTRKDIPFSKEILRQFYQKSSWFKDLQQAKKRDGFHFKKIVMSTPEKLSPKQIKLAEYIYFSIAKSLAENCSFQDHDLEKELKENFRQIVIFGKGGREHALASRLSKEESVQMVYVVPGNPGMQDKKILPKDVHKEDYVDFCKNAFIDLAIIGPEDLLAEGLGDTLKSAGIPTFAPSKLAASLESSKAFSKKLMQKYHIPTAQFENFTSFEAAKRFILEKNWDKFVIKQSSLAAGKGVIICDSKEDAIFAAEELFKFDTTIVVEEFLRGREVSFFAICLGEKYKILGHACDYKRLKTDNLGPNTGGMGCYAPAFWLSKTDIQFIEQDVLIPTLKAIRMEAVPFKGVLFIGLMMCEDGPKVLEYNVRFGDPETQTLMPLIQSGFLESLLAVAREDITTFIKTELSISGESSIHIVKASKGYPGMFGGNIELGKEISNNFHSTEKLQLYFAGVKKENNSLYTSGGRVLGITSIHQNLNDARELAYKNINQISFEGEQFREDIGL